MREIKFRAWIKSKKIMMTPMLSWGESIGQKWIQHDNRFNDEENGYMWGVKDLEIMQFTGLKDCKGVDIYEGDVVSYWDGTMFGCNESDELAQHYPKTPPHYFKRSENKKSLVVFNNQSFRIERGNALGSGYLESKDLKVIGNIHESPDLLESEQ